MNEIPPSLRVFIAGVTGSGKSYSAWKHYLIHYPRRLLVDLTGEWEPYADAVVTDTRELAATLYRLAARGRWTISLETGLEELPELVNYLIPVPHVERSPIRQMHGAVLLVDEVDLVAPPRSLREEIRTLWRRSRHAGLSIVSTTQRPEAVSREVSAQSTHVLALYLTEPSAFEYMSDIMRMELRPALVEWTRRHPHGGLWRDLRTGHTLWLEESGRLTKPVAAPEREAPEQRGPGPEEEEEAPEEAEAEER